jgi:streptogramin lyase
MLWVASARGHSITQIDTITRKPVRIIAGPRYHLGAPGAMALAAGKLWVLNTAGNSLTEIDAATGRRIAVLAGAAYRFHRPTAIAAYQHAIWVASASSVTRIALPLSRTGSAAK